MRWTPGDRGNIQDMRGRTGGRAMPLGIGGFVVLLLLSWATGTEFLSLFTQSAPTESVGTSGDRPTNPAEEKMVDFVDAVTTDAQRTWGELLGSQYRPTQVVLFRDAIQSACGSAESATGPFYCPGDQKVYLDLGFFDELSQRFSAPGDFAQAYVIAHEIGHHVQNVLGLGVGQSRSNSASVAIELQADCFAGVWGHAAAADGNFQAGRVELEPGDADEALQAASAIGDDRLQKMATGRVMPDRFTHGSSAQRVEWFSRGFDSGDPRSCDTGAAR